MEFWTAVQLRNEFNAEANFYRMDIGNKLYLCRNHAVILRKGFTSEDQPDAVVVMANPGSCMPADPSYQPTILKRDFIKAPYVRVKMDPTQCQLARLMKRLNFNVLSIINLSDLCAGKMDDFGEKLRELERHNVDNHSIFSDSRVDEREAILNGGKSILFLAWGQNSKIRSLASEAKEKVPKNRNTLGLTYESPKWAYRHPYPMIQDRCKEWLKGMHEQYENLKIQEYTAATKEEMNDEKVIEDEF